MATTTIGKNKQKNDEEDEPAFLCSSFLVSVLYFLPNTPII